MLLNFFSNIFMVKKIKYKITKLTTKADFFNSSIIPTNNLEFSQSFTAPNFFFLQILNWCMVRINAIE